MDLGTRIAAWRNWKGWTQAQLAGAAELSRASVCQYEGAGKHKGNPSQGALNAIVGALGLTLEQFYGAIPKAKPKKKNSKSARAVA